MKKQIKKQIIYILLLFAGFTSCVDRTEFTQEEVTMHEEDVALTPAQNDSLYLIHEANMPGTKDDNVRSSSAVLPRYDHVFMVWFENQSFSNIYQRSAAPFLNSDIIQKGTTFTNFLARTNDYSQPNYVAFFAGTGCGIADNNCRTPRSLSQRNIYTQLNQVGKTFAIYSEDLPSEGYSGCKINYYRLRHNTVPYFNNVPTSANKMWSQLPTNLASAPTFSWLVGNLKNDMHDTNVSYGDNWAKNNLKRIIDYCKVPANYSVFILAFDEGSGSDRRICVAFVGNGVRINHTVNTSYGPYNLNSTLLHMYGATVVNSAVGYADMAGWY